MKITLLGTGTSQGVPVITCGCEVCMSEDIKDNRLRSSIMVEVDDLVIVVDTGPDFRQQMLREGVKTLDAILFTHEHKDHLAGLDDVRAFNFKMKQAVDIYAEIRIQEVIKKEFSYVFAKKKYPGVPQINMHTIKNELFTIKGTEVLPVRVMHHKLPVFGFRFKDFAYITDANSVSEIEMKKLIGVKVLIVNALRKEKHMSHYNVEEAISLIQKLSPEKAYLTHISHVMGKHVDVDKELPENIFLAYDGLRIELF